MYVEFAFYAKVFEFSLPETEIFFNTFNCNKKNFHKFIASTEKLSINKYAAKSYEEFNLFKKDSEQYQNLKIKDIAVCATMSAGKSTFVNALLGCDVLPARNEATTAKITSAYDKDGAKQIIGFVEKNGAAQEQTIDVKTSQLDSWNERADVDRIFLQGDLDGIGNDGIIAALHDTPGTNNSGDKSHHDITFEFLAKNKMDALIYVSNATQIATDDERTMLCELYENVVKPSSIPVIFVLNKADCLDEEKEDISKIMADYKVYLESIGYKNPKVFALSARAARLLKMARNGKSEEFTLKEAKDFDTEFIQFSEIFDFSDKKIPDFSSEEKILVGKKEYLVSDIHRALYRTGIAQIEKHIEKLF